ncbi:MAG: hypothetical protein OEY87_04075 [Gammaproteobacteria bacterium]|nr:hypothetical protein [Gammaproteobacteria bacterium]MDH5735281.1 hypothetical protein [Gammaproteobacteria bacterium]
MLLTQAQVNQQYNNFKKSGATLFSDAAFGFMPAFKDLKTEETHLSTYDDGTPAVLHVLDGLPVAWIGEWGDDGRPDSVRAGVIAGFMRGGCFYTIDDIMNRLRDA